ncbi:hypothetical protein LINPERPRIM_LOCUS36554 [Linum perenne]
MERFLSNDDHQYERHVDQVLSLRSDCSSVRKVRIDCEFHLYRMNLRDRVFDKIVKYAASHGVQELFICSRQSKTVDELLGSLTLTDCWLKFGDASVDAFANFPILESLKLVHCCDPGTGFETSVLKVRGSKLINLDIVSPGFNSFEIDAPKLQTFGLKSHYPYGTLPDLSKSNLPSLNHANIELSGDKHMFMYIFASCSDIIKQRLLEPCTNLFKVLHNAQALILQIEPLEEVGLVCSCYQSLKVLMLSEAYIENTVFGLWSCLQLLESLTLKDCCFNFGDVSVDAFANFPILESLKLVHCYDPGMENRVLKVTGSKLINLEIDSPGFDSLEIDAPKLQTFGLKSHYPYGTLPDVSKSNLPSLNRANIELLGDKHMFVYIFPRANDIMKQQVLELCTNLLKVLHNAQALILQVEPLEVCCCLLNPS